MCGGKKKKKRLIQTESLINLVKCLFRDYKYEYYKRARVMLTMRC